MQYIIPLIWHCVESKTIEPLNRTVVAKDTSEGKDSKIGKKEHFQSSETILCITVMVDIHHSIVKTHRKTYNTNSAT